jgi:Ca2+-binding EF-hand superfamily protein
MRHANAASPGVLPLVHTMIAAGCLCVQASVLAADEGEEYEQNLVDRIAGRLARTQTTDHARWVKELETAFPKRVTEPTSEEGYGQWFELLAGSGTEWRRPLGPTNPLAKLYREVAEDRKLGPVPSISRSEFMRYTSRELYRDHRRARRSLPDPNAEADKAFRVLDDDGDGVLSRTELSTPLRDASPDTSGNGRVERDEYLAYFKTRVLAAVPAAIAKAEKEDDDDDDDDRQVKPKQAEKPDEDLVVPEWFFELDVDEDNQIALSEWRKGGGEIEHFGEMDLDKDGLLTREEYLRFAESNDKTQQQEPPARDIEPRGS